MASGSRNGRPISYRAESPSRGFHDIAIGLHDSAFIEQYAEDCYATQYPIEGARPKQPTIVGCN
jgi:hypothetical protein